MAHPSLKSLPTLLTLLTLLIFPPAVFAADKPPSICDFEKVFSGILGFALGFAGLAMFIMFIVGGYKWLTAGTNEKAVQQARGTFTLALLGLALTFGAWFALLFIKNFTGIDVTQFAIPNCP